MSKVTEPALDRLVGVGIRVPRGERQPHDVLDVIPQRFGVHALGVCTPESLVRVPWAIVASIGGVVPIETRDITALANDEHVFGLATDPTLARPSQFEQERVVERVEAVNPDVIGPTEHQVTVGDLDLDREFMGGVHGDRFENGRDERVLPDQLAVLFRGGEHGCLHSVDVMVLAFC